MISNTTGFWNVAVGISSMIYNTTGYHNIAIGYTSLLSNTTGSWNTAVGDGTLTGEETGYLNTFLGRSANMGGDYHNSTGLGADVEVMSDNTVRIGSDSIISIGGFTNWTNISDGRIKANVKQNVPGLTFINKLNPVTYHLDLAAADLIMQRPIIPLIEDSLQKNFQLALVKERRKTKEQIVYSGFIAQDVEKAAKEIGYDFSGVDAAKNKKDLYGLRYAEFVVPLVKAVQELSKENTELKNQNASLESRLAKLEAMLNVNAPVTSNK